MGCGCLVALGAMVSPRFALVIVWLLTDQTTHAFERFWIGFVGFLFLPWTTLVWALAYAPGRGVRGFGLVLVLFAFFVDLSTHAAAARARRERTAR